MILGVGAATIIILGFLASIAGVAVLSGCTIGTVKKLTRMDKLIVMWLLFDSQIRLFLTGSFLLLVFMGDVQIDSFVAIPWREVGKVDTKWLTAHPVVVAVQVFTFATAPLCFLTLAGIIYDTNYRLFFQPILSFSELFGVYMIFSAEWLSHGKNLQHSGDLLYVWALVILINGLWVVFPVILLCNTWYNLQEIYALRDTQLVRNLRYTSSTNLYGRGRSRSFITQSASQHRDVRNVKSSTHHGKLSSGTEIV